MDGILGPGLGRRGGIKIGWDRLGSCGRIGIRNIECAFCGFVSACDVAGRGLFVLGMLGCLAVLRAYYWCSIAGLLFRSYGGSSLRSMWRSSVRVSSNGNLGDVNVLGSNCIGTARESGKGKE